MKRLWALVCLFLFAVHPAFAETRSIAYATWNVTGANARVLYMLPANAAKTLARPGAPVLTIKQVADYVLAHLSVSRQGQSVPRRLDQGEDLGPDQYAGPHSGSFALLKFSSNARTVLA